jgi:NNP family nitrate/nitrite transporter-like MFS transporter
VLGFTAAVAAYGGFFIPKSYGSSIAATGGPSWRCGFIAFYLLCIVATWWFYARRDAELPC